MQRASLMVIALLLAGAVLAGAAELPGAGTATGAKISHVKAAPKAGPPHQAAAWRRRKQPAAKKPAGRPVTPAGSVSGSAHQQAPTIHEKEQLR